MKTNNTPLRVLVIDDEPIIRFVLSMVFKKNAIVKTVDSAEEAIAELKSKFYDLCFLDIVLPGMNGLEAMKIINKISPNTKVTIMTGNSLDESMKTLIDDLAYEFIEKPFELSRIKEIANSVDGLVAEQQSH
jgi:DNA-binding NtrC family response regulator